MRYYLAYKNVFLMEELTKTQIVLLTLMVSFVTSIATGIITVALMDQAPAGVTQIVNRVVERTIETVVPAGGQGASVITKEVVVREDNLITDAIDKGSMSLVRIQKVVVGDDGSPVSLFSSYGVILSKDGLVAVDKTNLVEGASYRGIFSDGKVFDLKVVSGKESVSVTIMQVVVSEGTKDYTFTPIKLADSEILKLGQTVITLFGKDKVSVATGIISSIDKSEITEENKKQTTIAISANFGVAPEVYGNPMLNMFGEVVGMRTFNASGNYFIPSNLISADLSAYLATTKTDKTPSRTN